jgi:hypothetical protein
MANSLVDVVENVKVAHRLCCVMKCGATVKAVELSIFSVPHDGVDM